METTSGPTMSCQSFLPVSLHRAEAEDLASPLYSFDSQEPCEEHEESLTMFCLDDLEPLCEHCAAVSHAGHRVYLLTEASTDCKEELKTSLNGLKKRRAQFEKVTKNCEHASRHNQLITSLEEKVQLVEEELDAGGEGARFLKQYQDTMNSTCTAPVTLDPRTAGQSLRVSPGLNSVHITPGPSQCLDVPADPESFHPYSCIMAREGFDSGVHCWDIEVGDTNSWAVGVTAHSVSRGADIMACPEAGLWCISLREGESAWGQMMSLKEEDQVITNDSWKQGDINALSTKNNGKKCERLNEDKKSKPQGGTLKNHIIKTKPAEQKSKDNKAKKQSSKPRFSVTYHVSLNRALNIINNESDSHKQIQMNHVDHLVNHACVK
ncbi:E3 ubiquitin-protein ligase TRIM39 [Dissostichus eleginoides]|uniref:E3 ubiquitin-protein ligase TRIM39 n=1 Tax=Dissostichus eleginoides TaxID=100907 RepID=A0AAD9BM69_DISEL|nr:E3 ubiquitin-protein ligase TRIM39 [Dissostichus eleginoides]